MATILLAAKGGNSVLHRRNDCGGGVKQRGAGNRKRFPMPELQLLPWRAVVYMAESIALAVLENLVHMARQDCPRGYVCVAAVLPDGIRIVHEKDLRRSRALAALTAQELGDGWLSGLRRENHIKMSMTFSPAPLPLP